jgi:hypothetical protein
MELFNIYLIETCVDKNSIKIKNDMQWITFDEGEWGIGESTPKVDRISCNSSLPKVHEFEDSNSFASLKTNTLQTKRSWESSKIEVLYKLRNKKIKERIENKTKKG